MSSSSESGKEFQVINSKSNLIVYENTVGEPLRGWNSGFPDIYALDFSTVNTPGTYVVRLADTPAIVSPSFQIGSGNDLYRSLLRFALFFYQAQQDGPIVNSSVLDREPSHLTDENATVYKTPVYRNDVLQGDLTPVGGPVNVTGGWFDAGDYIKLVETASYTDAVMLFAVKSFPSLLSTGSEDFSGQALYGLNWLQEMWNESTKTLYYQVGIGDGNGNTILGDHDTWRLPQADDQLIVAKGDPLYYVKYRPVFEAGPPRSLISPNLAGRLAADFALCYQVYYEKQPGYANKCLESAETVFDLAKTKNVGQLLTAAPYDYYPETEWRDDMELGATELYFAVALAKSCGLCEVSSLPHSDPIYYLRLAAHWAHEYINGPGDGVDSLNLYDVSGLAHYELCLAIAQAGNPSGLQVSKSDLLADLALQLNQGVKQSQRDPFGLGVAYGGVDATPHALGYVLESNFYDQLSNSSTYAQFGETERNWVFGENAWGSSFIVGIGTTIPDCLQHQVANLVGSLTGTPPLLLYGAAVDGPNAISTFRGLGFLTGMKRCPVGGGDPNAEFTGKGARYFDNVIAWPSTEPSDDYTVLSIVLYASEG
jgi:hypothetical protein